MLVLTGLVLLLFAVRPAYAENLVITQPTDFWFNYDVPTTFSARTYQIPDHPSDPQLWLYNSEGTLLTTNDDYYGLQSYIQIQVEPGWYRLRAGTCCYQPDVWRIWDTTWNIDYELSVVGMTDSPTTTSDSSTTTTEGATTTSSIVEWQTTTSTLTPTSVPESTSLPSTSSPTSSTTTTTLPTPTTTTSTTLAPTTTEQSTTTTVTPSSLLTTTSSLMLPTSSLPSTSIPTTTVSPPVRTTTTLVSTTTTGTPTTTTVVTAPTSTVTSVATSTTTTTIPTTADTPEEAVAILESFSDPVAVEAAITQIAENLDTLTTEQLDEIAAVVSKAPKAVKEKFESEINIFGGGLDNYTPVGSTVNVGERRTLVVIGAVLTAMPVIAPRRK